MQGYPDTNPTNQFGSKIDWSFTIGLLTGNTLEKAAPNLSGYPQLIDAFIATYFIIPPLLPLLCLLAPSHSRGYAKAKVALLWQKSIVKCSLFFLKKLLLLKNNRIILRD